MDSIFSKLPRDLRFVIYKKFMHEMFREQRAAIKKYFRDEVQPEIVSFLINDKFGHYRCLYVCVHGSQENNVTTLHVELSGCLGFKKIDFIDRALRIHSNGECDLCVFEQCFRHPERPKFITRGKVLVYEGLAALSLFPDRRLEKRHIYDLVGVINHGPVTTRIPIVDMDEQEGVVFVEG
jgi:hypothetical protein